jgi:glycosyltransferase involved in cell wall biosynthesis
VNEVVLHVGKVSGISGSEAHLLTLLPDLRRRGWDVRFCLLHEREPGASEFAARLEDAGVPVVPVRLRGDLDPVAFLRLLRLVRATRPVLLHTHLVHADAYGLPAGRLAGVPVLASTKHGFNTFRERPAFAAVDRRLSRLANLHIAISAGLARYLAETEGLDGSRFEIVHYGIAAGGDPQPPPHAPRLLCVGRLVPIKGHDTLLHALALAVASIPDLTLEIAGDGPLRGRLEELARDLGIAEAATFAGRVTSVADAYARAGIVVVPSRGEGFGMVALEAAERGRAVIASAVGGLPEIVDDGVTGVLVKPGDVEELAAAIAALAADPERAAALGAAARERALREFTLERCADRTDALYRTAVDRSASTRSRAAAASSATTKSHGTR